MDGTSYQIAVYQSGQSGRIEREQLTLDGLAERTGLHPDLIERFVEYGLIEPAQLADAQMLFDIECVLRLRKIERLRRDLGVNTTGAAVILDLLDRMITLQRENESLIARL
ncbi:MAG: Chaperone modulatory protein CbpM [Acidobacteria bacterium]|nr:Chaperone modulatory protein CbpM [Acidobacteriota bacterium]